jgi:hypothetical protein
MNGKARRGRAANVTVYPLDPRRDPGASFTLIVTETSSDIS